MKKSMPFNVNDEIKSMESDEERPRLNRRNITKPKDTKQSDSASPKTSSVAYPEWGSSMNNKDCLIARPEICHSSPDFKVLPILMPND
jgi:hypothetical protein